MGGVDLDRLARSFNVSTDAQLMEELAGLRARIGSSADVLLAHGRVGERVPGLRDDLSRATEFLEWAEEDVQAAILACEEHQRGVA